LADRFVGKLCVTSPVPLARVPLNDQILPLYITEPPEFVEKRLEPPIIAGFVHLFDGNRRVNDRKPVDLRRLLRRRGERPRDRRANQAANKFATPHVIPDHQVGEVGRSSRRLGGLNPALPFVSRTIPAARKIVSEIGTTEVCPVQCLGDGTVAPLAPFGEAGLAAATQADGFVIVPEGGEGCAQGAPVVVYLYDEGGPHLAVETGPKP
jgi:hypothetical protein